MNSSVPRFLLDERRREGVGRVDRAEQVHAEHAVPVGRLQVPERKAEFARAHADGIDDVLDADRALLSTCLAAAWTAA